MISMDSLQVLLASLLKSLQDVLLSFSHHLLYFPEVKNYWREVFQRFIVMFISVILNKLSQCFFKL